MYCIHLIGIGRFCNYGAKMNECWVGSLVVGCFPAVLIWNAAGEFVGVYILAMVRGGLSYDIF